MIWYRRFCVSGFVRAVLYGVWGFWVMNSYGGFWRGLFVWAVFSGRFLVGELFGVELRGRATGVSCGGATLGNNEVAYLGPRKKPARLRQVPYGNLSHSAGCSTYIQTRQLLTLPSISRPLLHGHHTSHKLAAIQPNNGQRGSLF